MIKIKIYYITLDTYIINNISNTSIQKVARMKEITNYMKIKDIE